MKIIYRLVLSGLLLFVGTANALPIIGHTNNGSGIYTITFDSTNESADMVSVEIGGRYDVELLGGDTGEHQNHPNSSLSYHELWDSNPDDLISFSFMPQSFGDTRYVGGVIYSDGTVEQFAYFIPPPNSTPSSSVPEPSTFLLFGAGLIGMAGARIRMKKQN
jgi:hypothetical protein